jgi:hypothetical protein
MHGKAPRHGLALAGRWPSRVGLRARDWGGGSVFFPVAVSLVMACLPSWLVIVVWTRDTSARPGVRARRIAAGPAKRAHDGWVGCTERRRVYVVIRGAATTAELEGAKEAAAPVLCRWTDRPKEAEHTERHSEFHGFALVPNGWRAVFYFLEVRLSLPYKHISLGELYKNFVFLIRYTFLF